MSTRLPSELLVKAMIRRAFDEGGSASVLARGDASGGGMLIVTLSRGRSPRFFERGIGASGAPTLIRSGPLDEGELDESMASAYWQRRRARDPDLWVVELDTAGAERLAAEILALD